MLEDEHLFFLVVNFMIAGRDTTSCLLTHTFNLLHHHPAARV